MKEKRNNHTSTSNGAEMIVAISYTYVISYQHCSLWDEKYANFCAITVKIFMIYMSECHEHSNWLCWFRFFFVFCSPLPVSCTMNCSHSWRFTLFFFSFRVKSSLFVLHRYHKKRGKKFDKSKTYQKSGRNHHLIVEAVVCHYNSYSRFWHIHAPMLSCSVTAT